MKKHLLLLSFAHVFSSRRPAPCNSPFVWIPHLEGEVVLHGAFAGPPKVRSSCFHCITKSQPKLLWGVGLKSRPKLQYLIREK